MYLASRSSDGGGLYVLGGEKARHMSNVGDNSEAFLREDAGSMLKACPKTFVCRFLPMTSRSR